MTAIMPLLNASLLNGYRAFVAKLSSRGYLDDASRRPRANSKLLRAKALIARGGVDPWRAFRRLKQRRAVENGEIQELFGSEGLFRTSVILGLGGLSKLFMTVGNDTVIEGEEHLHRALQRESGRPLITVSNHVASIDDPLVTSILVPPSEMLHPTSVRWTLCATDRCFGKASLVPFFRAAKVLPVERGAGLHQIGMKAAERRLNQGDWVHIFPEGTRSKTGELLPPRLGIGKLVADCDRLPLVIPFVHSGMQDVMPSGSVLPKMGKRIRVMVGAPITFTDVLAMAEERSLTDGELYKAISHKIGQRMAQMWAKLENKPLPAWAHRTLSFSRQRSAVLNEIFETRHQRSFVQYMGDQIERELERMHHYLAQYLHYCQLRQCFVRDRLLSLAQ